MEVARAPSRSASAPVADDNARSALRPPAAGLPAHLPLAMAATARGATDGTDRIPDPRPQKKLSPGVTRGESYSNICKSQKDTI